MGTKAPHMPLGYKYETDATSPLEKLMKIGSNPKDTNVTRFFECG